MPIHVYDRGGKYTVVEVERTGRKRWRWMPYRFPLREAMLSAKGLNKAEGAQGRYRYMVKMAPGRYTVKGSQWQTAGL